ncbi:MAG: Fic family protein [archaeon]|nr:Fic family protein [archaeon]
MVKPGPVAKLPKDLSGDALLAHIQEVIMGHALESNREYPHWEEFRYRDLPGTDAGTVWTMMKHLRGFTARKVVLGGHEFSYNLPEMFLEKLHFLDTQMREFTFTEGLDSRSVSMYLGSSDVLESIASCHIEGAETSIPRAKKMLREGTEPNDRSELMIRNNFLAYAFVRDNRERELDAAFIRDIHSILTKDLLPESQCGSFRTDDRVKVMDMLDGSVKHDPPSCSEIGRMIEDLCRFVNDEGEFTHPVVKAMLAHFLLAFIHPFNDGNGRLSRLMFYWCMLHHGYSSMEYLAVSKAICEHRGRYYRAFEHVESDGLDMTYFLKYHMYVLEQAVGAFESYVGMKESSRMGSVRETGLNARQSLMLSDFDNGMRISVYELSAKYCISLATARNDIRLLSGKGLVRICSKESNKLIYDSAR